MKPNFIVSGFTQTLTPDHLEIDFKDAGGISKKVAFPGDHLANFLLQLETSAAELFELAKAHLKGFDPRLMGAVRGLSCRQIDIGGADNGDVVLMITTDQGMKLNLGMSLEKAGSLMQRIETLLHDRNSGSSKPN